MTKHNAIQYIFLKQINFGNAYSFKLRQKGSMLIPVIVLIVIVGLLATTITMLFGSSVKSAVDNNFSMQAFYVSEAGLEKGTRGWSADSLYAGEGPIAFGPGSFTVSVANTDFSGIALPSSQKRIISKGYITGATNVLRTVERIVAKGGAILNETFVNLNSWQVEGSIINNCRPGDTMSLLTGGQVAISGGAFMAEVTLANARRKGYRQNTLSTALSSGSTPTISFRYSKEKSSKPPQELMMGFDLVWSDSTYTRLWSHCGATNVNWTTFSTTTTVPAGKSLTAVRLVYDVFNANKAAINRIFFDDINISGSAFSIISWRETFP